VLDAIADLQQLAYEFAAWHLEFRDQAFKWDTYGSRNPLVRRYGRPRGLPIHTGPTRRCSLGRSRGGSHSSRLRLRRRRRCSSAPTPAARSRSWSNRRPRQRRETAVANVHCEDSFRFRLRGSANTATGDVRFDEQQHDAEELLGFRACGR
jgi:hypothetical protein